jgi:hypothetical protein
MGIILHASTTSYVKQWLACEASRFSTLHRRPFERTKKGMSFRSHPLLFANTDLFLSLTAFVLLLNSVSSSKVRCIVFVQMLFEHKFLTTVLTFVLGFCDLLDI